MYYPMHKKFFDTFFRGDFPNQGKYIFLAHYEELRRLVLKKRLLEYRITDTWESLCEFLEQPIPKGVPFPHVNDNSGYAARSCRRNRNKMYNVAIRYTTNLVFNFLIGFAFWYLNFQHD